MPGDRIAGNVDHSRDLGVVRRRQFDLHDARQGKQLRTLEVAEAADVVEREVIAVVSSLLEHVDRAVVERCVLTDLDDHALGRHRSMEAVNDEAGAGVDHPESVADHVFHAPLEQHTFHDPACGCVGVVEDRGRVGAAAVEQFVSEDLTVDVDHRLTSEEHLRGHAIAPGVASRATALRDRIVLNRRVPACLHRPRTGDVSHRVSVVRFTN